MSPVFKAEDGKKRCLWCKSTPGLLKYHDEEWGFPVKDDFRLFEKLSLEGFQAGLSWRTVLEKRENFRKAFAQFNFNKVARFTKRDVNTLLKDSGLIRHKGKIEAVIINAQCAISVVEEYGSLSKFIWTFKPGKVSSKELQSALGKEAAAALAKELKKQGWKFVGPTTVYAFMQSMGLVNDHAPECYFRKMADQQRKDFRLP